MGYTAKLSQWNNSKGYYSELNSSPSSSAPHPEKRYVQLEPVSVNLFRKRSFGYVIKDLKMRSSWIMVSLKSNDKCLVLEDIEE